MPRRFLTLCLVLASWSACSTATMGDLVVTNFSANTVVEFNAAGNPTTFASGLNGPDGLAFDAAGNVYVGNETDRTIHRYSASGADLGVFATVPGGRIEGLAFDAAGHLYVAGYDSGTVREFSATGADLGNFVMGISSPGGLAFDPSGNLYVSSLGGNKVEKYSSAGTDLGTFASTGLNSPFGLAFDASGNLLVSNRSGNSIRRFSSTGADLGNFVSSGLNGPVGLAFDASGDLFVANESGGTIGEFSPTGVNLGTFATGLSLPVFLGFQPTVVPEPGGLILVTTGFLGVLAYARRPDRGNRWPVIMSRCVRVVLVLVATTRRSRTRATGRGGCPAR